MKTQRHGSLADDGVTRATHIFRSLDCNVRSVTPLGAFANGLHQGSSPLNVGFVIVEVINTATRLRPRRAGRARTIYAGLRTSARESKPKYDKRRQHSTSGKGAAMELLCTKHSPNDHRDCREDNPPKELRNRGDASEDAGDRIAHQS